MVVRVPFNLLTRHLHSSTNSLWKSRRTDCSRTTLLRCVSSSEAANFCRSASRAICLLDDSHLEMVQSFWSGLLHRSNYCPSLPEDGGRRVLGNGGVGTLVLTSRSANQSQPVGVLFGTSHSLPLVFTCKFVLLCHHNRVASCFVLGLLGSSPLALDRHSADSSHSSETKLC